PGEGRAGLLGHADEHLAGHADDGAVTRRPRAAPRDHGRGRLRTLLTPRPASRPARARGDDPRGAGSIGRLSQDQDPYGQWPAARLGGIATYGLEPGDQAVGPLPAAEEEKDVYGHCEAEQREA